MKGNSRRKFLETAAGMIAGGLMSGSAVGNAIAAQATGAGGEIMYRTLGRTGVKLPIVSMGVMNSNNPNLLKVAWNSGVRHFDTAWGYQGGNNERMIGKFVRDMKISRKDVIITTKIELDEDLFKKELHAERKKQFLTRFGQSLERLQMDYVDILMLHSVNVRDQVHDPAIIEAMQELRHQGKIRFPAFSTHVYWPEIITNAADGGFFDVALISVNYSMSHDEESLKAMQYAVSKGMGLIAMKTQCQQDWYKHWLPAETQKFYEGSVMHSALLKWVLRLQEITTAVPGFTTFEQLEGDMKTAWDIRYTPDEKKFLEDHNVKLAIQSVCRFCGGCLDTCPKGADIPALMRTHMYALSYGNLYMTRKTHSAIAPGRGLDVCQGCDGCVAQCRNRVNIARRVEELMGMMV